MTAPDSPRFRTTRWSMVLRAGRIQDEVGRRALSELCAAYWYPLYAYLRRQGNDADRAADLTQGFFARLIEKGDLAGVETGRGRFRSFLLAAIRNFATNEWHAERAARRGGDTPVLSLDVDDAETRYRREPVDAMTAEKLFARRWALTVLATVVEQLAVEMRRKGRGEIFATLKTFLEGDGQGPAYAEVAATLGMTEGAVKVAVHRLRTRFRELLLAEIAQTLADRDAASDELAELLAALRG